MGDAADDMFDNEMTQGVLLREDLEMNEQEQYTTEQMINMLHDIKLLLKEALSEWQEGDTPEDIIELTQAFRDKVYEFDLAVEAYENGEIYEQE